MTEAGTATAGATGAAAASAVSTGAATGASVSGAPPLRRRIRLSGVRVKRTLGATAKGCSQVGSSDATTGGGRDTAFWAAAVERGRGETGGRAVGRMLETTHS